MINTIILDIGQVLGDFCWDGYLRNCGYDEETIRKVGLATVLSNDWAEEDRGVLSDEELILLFTKNDPSVENEIRTFIENITKTVKEYEYSADFVKSLKEYGYKVYLLSNYGKRNFEYAKEHFEFTKYVDGGVISYQVNHVKPEPEIYEALIQKYNINPREAVYLDDSVVNLEGAKPYGFYTIHVTDFEEALEELRDLGIRV
jgi:putative hydrolase of the HAD superfamily